MGSVSKVQMKKSFDSDDPVYQSLDFFQIFIVSLYKRLGFGGVLCEFVASLVYIANSRTAKATHRKTPSQKTSTKIHSLPNCSLLWNYLQGNF